jgi:hypothetical protein
MANDDDNDILSPNDLGRKLVTALRSVTDPQALMQSISDRSVLNLRAELSTEIRSMKEATSLWHDDLVRVPTDVQKSVSSLREFLEQFIHASINKLQSEIGRELERVSGATDKLDNVSEERFKSIQIQFTLLKQATEQLDIANKTAIAAALQAQKEQAAETQKTSQAAIAKSETSTAEAIKALTTTFNTVISGIEIRINDLKSRMDRNEGKSVQADPEIAAALREIKAMSLANAGGDGEKRNSDKNQVNMIALIAALAAVAVVIVELFVKH